ncbi:hypothetical protein A33Q_0911 [Indibacter alkaliphilus LW1]|uniref:TerB family tellurite resistance protein n=1 Tax=Indibacter alkaliphilus (strain CCUG 57479 / KCTC 22604 / LW1) TaxID=1189612 RepID=S2E9E6_INDAL|nr:hypothetical protein [Indibacter alkaliphilus]EOZ98928.1 hypothetical protein A33Q_0911 [Indibacter alkaliphilus LW1]
MKRLFAICLCFQMCFTGFSAKAQDHEIQQLLLNVDKLNQLRSILTTMEDGYNILSKGYTGVRDLSQGNFSLHRTFFDALLEVSPQVRNYYRIREIIDMQLRVIRLSGQSLNYFRQSGSFGPNELAYMQRYYGRLMDRSISNLQELGLILTAGRLSMSDDQRLAAIDGIHRDMGRLFSAYTQADLVFAGIAGLKRQEQHQVSVSLQFTRP